MSELTPSQVAQLTLTSGALNDTQLVDRVFDRLEDGNALENMDKFFSELTADGMVGCSSPRIEESLSLAFNQSYYLHK